MIANGDIVTGQGLCGRHVARAAPSRLRRRADLLLLLALMFVLARAMAADAVDITAVVGFTDSFRPGHWAPLTVTVTNRGGDLRGELEVQVTGDDVLRGRQLVTSHRRNLELTRDSRKSLQFTVLPQGLSHPLVIRVRANGRELARAEVDLRTRFTSERLLLALTRDADLDYLNDSAVEGLRVLYPHPELLPVHWRGYDAVAAIVLRGVSLERLSASQFDALHKWIAQGGILAVSGGADFALLRSPRLAALLPAAPLGMMRVDAAALQQAFSPSLDVSRPVYVHRLGALRGFVRLRAGNAALIVERALGLGRVLYLTFDVAGYPFDRWEGMRALWLDKLRLPPPTTATPNVTHPGFQSPLGALIQAEATDFPAFSTVFLFLALYLGTLFATSTIPVRATRHRWLVPASRWVAPVLFAPMAWLLFGPAAFPRGATAVSVSLIEPLPDSRYARLGLELGVYANRSGALRLEYRGVEPTLYPHRQAEREGKAADWVFGEASRHFVETLDRRRYVLHVLEGDDVIAFHLEASVYDETAGPRLIMNNASGGTLENLWLLFGGYAYEIGAMAAGTRVERKFIRATHGIDVGKTPWRQVLKPPAGVPAHMTEPAQIVLERRAQALGESGYPGPGHALLTGYTASPLQPAGASADWAHRQRALIAFRVAAIAGGASPNEASTEPMARGNAAPQNPEPPGSRGTAGNAAHKGE